VTARCPSDLALEAHLLGPARSQVSPHLEVCDRCRARVARMQQEGEEFRRFVFPATVAAVESAAEKRRPRLAFIFGPVGAFAAMTAALLVFVRTQGPDGPDAGYVGTKGSGIGLAAFVNGEGGARPLEDGEVVPASAAIRFRVSPAAEGCFLWILSVDAKGQVSRIYPPKGDSPEARGAGVVPGGAVLDGEPGPERLFAVCAPAAMAWGEVKSAAPAAAGPDAVRQARALGGPLSAAPQSTLLLEKRP
jgi:hypothetical protein